MNDAPRGWAKKGVDLFLVWPACHVGWLRRTIHYASVRLNRWMPVTDRYAQLKERFVRNGEQSRYDATLRARMVERFEEIDRGIRIASSPVEGLILAEAMLSLKSAGDIVECGCFNGGSTAKLSIAAQVSGRNLVVFDSFEGLPEHHADEHEELNVRTGTLQWQPGSFAAAQQRVQANVEKYGEESACRYVKGWFSETMTPENLPKQIAFAFVDADLPSSVRDCLLGIWPRMSDGAVFFTHDACHLKVLQVLADPEIWNRFQQPPPILFGAGFGFGETAANLGMMMKGAFNSDDFHRLLIEK